MQEVNSDINICDMAMVLFVHAFDERADARPGDSNGKWAEAWVGDEGTGTFSHHNFILRIYTSLIACRRLQCGDRIVQTAVVANETETEGKRGP